MIDRIPKTLQFAARLSAACSLLVAAAAQPAHAQQRPGAPGALPFLTAPLESLAAPPASAGASETAPGSRPEPGRSDAGRAPERVTQTGRIAYYGRKFAGRRTASGERFDPEAMTMAHRTLPFGTRVRVTNLENGKSVIVRVNDRGPSTQGRIGDVSQAAAEQLEMVQAGVVDARLEVLRVRTVR
jgi:rare lipoprotein A